MKYYVLADTHGFYEETLSALKNSGYYEDSAEKRLVICGDLLDRGTEAVNMQNFALKELENGRLIFVKGNHEDLMQELCDNFERYALSRFLYGTYHIYNGTLSSAFQLTNFSYEAACSYPDKFKEALRSTAYFSKLLPHTVNYFETPHYVFVHGWVPVSTRTDNSDEYIGRWRSASENRWKKARWYNGMEYACRDLLVKGKTVVCGHWHTSWGHCNIHDVGTEFGNDAVFEPFYDEGIIALDACTVRSRKVNCIVLED